MSEITEPTLNTIKYDAEAKGLTDIEVLEWWNNHMARIDVEEMRRAAPNKRSTKSPWREFETALVDFGYWQNMRDHVARLRRRLRAVR